MDRTLNVGHLLSGQYDEFTVQASGRKAPGLFSLSVPSRFLCDMLYYPTPALSARSAKPGAMQQ